MSLPHPRIAQVAAESSPDGAARMGAALAQALTGGPPVLPLDPVAPAAVLSGAYLELPVEPDVALMVPTSGSTGIPKVVELTGAALRASGTSTHRHLGGPGRWLLALPLTHVAGIQVLLRSALAGFEPVALDLRHGFRAVDLIEGRARMDRLGASRRYISLVPTQLHRVLDDEGATEALASFDALLLGGAAAPAPLLERARAAGITIVTTYGMSETAGGCIYDGRPLPGVQWDLAGDGRIRLGGATLARGYRGPAELTSAAFAEGWFTTSDLGAAGPGGTLRVLGRADDVAVTGGEKVVLGEVETSLSAHPAVREAAVVAVPDPEWGERIVAWVIPAAHIPSGVVTAAPGLAAGADSADLDVQLRAHVRDALGRAAVPRHIRYVQELPRLPLGKVDRSAIRDDSR
jgi:O-succinylbenzoic acid--CoA ligase